MTISSIKATLAVRNLLRSGGRFGVSLFGIAFATFLMCVQGSLLYSFTLTASRVIDSVQADLWMIGKKVHGERLVAPPHRIEGINLIDVRTVAFCPSGSAADPGSESRRPFLLVPIVAGLSATFFHTEK